jgi:hypothetical protein
MALSLALSPLSYAPVVPAHAASTVSRASVAMESISDLKQLAKVRCLHWKSTSIPSQVSEAVHLHAC